MELSFLLIPVLGGYWVLTRTNTTKYKIYRQEGYHLFFSAAIAGALILPFAWPITKGLEALINAVLPSLFGSFLDEVLMVFVVAGIAWLVPPIIGWCSNKSQRELVEDAMIAEGNMIALVVQKALPPNEHLVEITTRNGKSYIGFPQSYPPPSRGDQDVALLVIMSGYRKHPTRELVITTNYASALRLSRQPASDLSHLTAEDFLIALPYQEIASARPFDLKAYKYFLQTAGGSGRVLP